LHLYYTAQFVCVPGPDPVLTAAMQLNMQRPKKDVLCV
jgi:hypothetical protein